MAPIPSYELRDIDASLPGGSVLVEKWPRTAEGAISAVNRAARLSESTGHPHEVRRPNGSLLCRYVAGKRTDLAAVGEL